MSLETTANRTESSGNGVTTVFSFPYYFLANSDLVVILRNNTTGVGVTQVITTNYTVTGAGVAAGGTVTMIVAPPAGYTLIIYRDPAITQSSDYRENDSLPAEQLEQNFDRLTMIGQRLDERMDRALRVSEEAVLGAFDLELPALLTDNPGATVIVNAGGTGFDIGPTADEIEDAQGFATAAAASASSAAAQVTLAAAQVTLATTQAGNAATSASASAASAVSAAASAAAAAAASVASQWSDVRYLTSADSPFTVTDAMAGTMFEVDTTGGAVGITLPAIAGLSLAGAWSIGVKKTNNSANNLTITRGSTDTIDGSTTKVISRQFSGCALIPDTDASPDKWTSVAWGEVPITGAIVGDTDAQTLTNKTLTSPTINTPSIATPSITTEQILTDISTPSNPSSGFKKLYAKTAGMFFKNSAGTEYQVRTATPPTVQKFTSGSGTYTTPAGVLFIEVELVGGGGGGAGGGTTNPLGTNAGNTTFGSTIVVGNGGSRGNANTGGAGGSASLSGASGTNLAGASGLGGFVNSTSLGYAIGGAGANSAFGGAGNCEGGVAGGTAIANTGAGGGGGSGSNAAGNNGGGGGGAGGYARAIITSPAASYAYAVGAAGTAGAAGTSGSAGGAGAAGLIVVREYYA